LAAGQVGSGVQHREHWGSSKTREKFKMKVVPVVAVIDEESGYEALYVDGILRLQSCTLHMCDIAEAAKGIVIEFSQIVVNIPEIDWPDSLENLTPFLVYEEASE
jgi:hypothetical protein